MEVQVKGAVCVQPSRAALCAGGAPLQFLALLAAILPACCLSKAGRMGMLELRVQGKGVSPYSQGWEGVPCFWGATPHL